MKYIIILLFLNTTALLAQNANWVFVKSETEDDSTGTMDYFIDSNSVVMLSDGSIQLSYKGVSSIPEYDDFDGRYAMAYIEEIIITCGEKYYTRNMLKVLYTNGTEYYMPEKFTGRKPFYPDTIIGYLIGLYCNNDDM